MTTYFNPVTQQLATAAQVISNPSLNFAVNAPDSQFIAITEVAQPAFDPILETIAQGLPTEANGVYTQTWTLTPNNALQQQAMLGAVQMQQIAALQASYQAAITANVLFTTAVGVSKTFQADLGSQQNLLLAATGYGFAGATPAGFYWVAADNTQVPMTLADLHGLYLAMLAQGQTAFNHLQVQKAAVNAVTASTPNPTATIQAINW